VDGAAAADVGPVDMISGRPGGSGGQHIEQLLQRLLLPRVKAALGEPNLAVRQVRARLQSTMEVARCICSRVQC
jgi:hypothetical protein